MKPASINGEFDGLDILWGLANIAVFLNLTLRQVEHRIKRGHLPVAKNGGKTFAFKSALRKYLSELLEAGR
jgi:hypothetical protein